MNQPPTYTPLSELGEFKLIEHLTQNIQLRQPSTVKGIGDDAAVLDFGDKQTVITTDLLVEGIHFDLTYTPLKHLGYKAVAVNLSDIYAMFATPTQITVSIAVSKRFGVEHLDELYEGILLACERYNVDFVGGDTSSSLTGMMISVTALGVVEKNKAVYRNTAKVNDLICVSGDLGAAYAGLQLLEREKKVFENNPNVQPPFELYDYILERQLKPEPRNDIANFLKENNFTPTAMIDVSDGLSSELLHICHQSKVGCSVFEEKIPLDVQTINFAEEVHIDTTTCALNGGEDYELLFTLPLEDYDRIAPLALDAGITIIGHITDAAEGTNLITRDGSSVPLSAQGWNAYKNE